MRKKNPAFLLIIFLSIMLIALVIWIYKKRMEEISQKMHQSFALEQNAFNHRIL